MGYSQLGSTSLAGYAALPGGGTSGGSNSAWASILELLKTPGGAAIAQSLLGGVGGALTSAAQSKQNDADRAQALALAQAQIAQNTAGQDISPALSLYSTQAQLANSLYGQRSGSLQDLYNSQTAEDLARQKIGLDVNAPERQDWRQSQALKAALMGGARPFKVQAPAGLGSYMPQISGGFNIPEGGFDAETLAFYSPEARLAQEQAFYTSAAPFTAAPDMSAVGYGGIAGNANTSLGAARDTALANILSGRQGVRSDLDTAYGNVKSEMGGALQTAQTGIASEQAARDQAIKNTMATLQAQATPAQKKKGSWWKTALKIAATVGAVAAAPATGGATLALIPAIQSVGGGGAGTAAATGTASALTSFLQNKYQGRS